MIITALIVVLGSLIIVGSRLVQTDRKLRERRKKSNRMADPCLEPFERWAKEHLR